MKKVDWRVLVLGILLLVSGLLWLVLAYMVYPYNYFSSFSGVTWDLGTFLILLLAPFILISVGAILVFFSLPSGKKKKEKASATPMPQKPR